MSKKVIFIIVGVILLNVAATFWVITGKGKPSELDNVLVAEPTLLRPFQLIDHTGQVFDLMRFKDKWTFMFFGYTHCPDICAPALAILGDIYKQLAIKKPEIAKKTQVIFVSVDSERDSAKKLGDFVNYFGPFLGIRGEKAEIDAFIAQFQAMYMKQPGEKPDEYTVVHPSRFYLIDPQARLRATFSQPQVPEDIINQYLKIIAY